MTKAIAAARGAVSDRDRSDASRLVEAALMVAAIPGIASPAARELAATRLRELMSNHPSAAELLAAIVVHIEGS